MTKGPARGTIKVARPITKVTVRLITKVAPPADQGYGPAYDIGPAPVCPYSSLQLLPVRMRAVRLLRPQLLFQRNTS